MDESRALRHAAWAGAGSVVLLAVAVALGYLVGVDDPSMSDSAILERLNDDARQVAAGIGMPVLATGVALLLWFATGLRWDWSDFPVGTRSRMRSCRRLRYSAG